jgi:hypothetical protein
MGITKYLLAMYCSLRSFVVKHHPHRIRYDTATTLVKVNRVIEWHRCFSETVLFQTICLSVAMRKTLPFASPFVSSAFFSV